MKYLFKFIFLNIGFLMLFSCESNNDEDRYPYYRFTTEDEQLIINYDYVPDQIIIYRNQLGEELNFKVISNERKKRGYYSRGTLSGGGGLLQNYYDSKIIRIDILENVGNSGGSGDYTAVNYVFSKNDNEFENGLNFPMWNVQLFSFINEIQDNVNIYLRDYNNAQKTTLNVNGHLFEKVVEINSGSDDSYNSFLFGSLVQNVNQIYYDYEFGVIQFKDIEGNEWKVIYPE